MKKINFVFSVLSLMMLVMFSCKSDNPVQPGDSQLDTARFNWQVTRLYPFFQENDICYSFWTPDTNEVFMCNTRNILVHYKNGQLSEMQYGANIRMYSIDGLSPTEGYIVGSERINDKEIPHIERWNGSSFTNVPINYNFDKDFHVSDIFVKSSTEMWISSPNGIVHKFDGYNLTQYYFQDTMMYSKGFFYDENNRLRYLSEYINSAIDTLQRNYVYEFDGQNWSKVYQTALPIYQMYYGIINNFVYAYDYPKTIYKLQNNVLVSVISMPNNISSGGFSGTSLNNIVGFGFTDARQAFFHWNGQKWSDEKVGNEADNDWLRMKMVNENYVCAVKYGQIPVAYLYRGYRKH